jgi:ATP phosphoribosyltransferase regulatory subunit HisZ
MIVTTNKGKVIRYDITIVLARTVAKRMEWDLIKKYED